jgi:hypothetical protein
MKPADISAILKELHDWEHRRREGVLKWSRIEEFSGFSRVALWSRTDIREAYQRAKHALRSDATPRIKERSIDERLSSLRSEIEEMRQMINRYDELWSLYESNMHRMGLDPAELRRPLDPIFRQQVRTPTPRWGRR